MIQGARQIGKGGIAVRKVSIIILFVLLMLLTATAQADGDWVCSECGRTVAGVLEAGDYCPYCDAHRHTWIPASCTEPERCSCGKTKGEPLGHEWEEATCTEPKTCARCGETEGLAKGHEWEEPIYDWSDDCKTVTAIRTCSHDKSHVETEIVNTSGKVTKAATCEKKGETTYTTSAYKNSAFLLQTKTVTNIAATGHSWGEPTYKWSEDNRTVTATRVCLNDKNHVETEIVNTSGKVTKAATCETKGKTTYTAVFRNSAFSKQTKTVDDISATGHNWGEPTYKWSEDNRTVTATRVCLNDQTHVETETVGTSSVVSAEPTCEAKGTRVYTSNSFKNSAFVIRTKSTKIPALGHEWVEATVFAPKTCSVCGKTEGVKKQVKVGDYITFGSYEQDNNLANGKEPIEWLVLEKEGSKALLISRYVLDNQAYHAENTDITWEKCSLRKWLNNYFLYGAFSTEEQKQILMTLCTADDNTSAFFNSFNRRDPGNDTKDEVFILSEVEYYKYFPSHVEGGCGPTEYAHLQGSTKYPNGNSRWWLRTPGGLNNYAVYVRNYGDVMGAGLHVNSGLGVRPALWINLDS